MAQDYSGQDLRGKDFSGAELVAANFSRANLADARFDGANLSHANFTDATGVVGAQFARATLTGAQLPSGVHFGALDTASEAAVTSAKIFVTMLLVCASPGSTDAVPYGCTITRSLAAAP